MTIPLDPRRPVMTTGTDKNHYGVVGLIESYCHQEFEVVRYVGVDGRNQPVWADPELIYGYWDRTPVRVRDESGVTVIGSGTIYFPLSLNLSFPQDRLYCKGERMTVVKTDVMRHFRNSHYEVVVQ